MVQVAKRLMVDAIKGLAERESDLEDLERRRDDISTDILKAKTYVSSARSTIRERLKGAKTLVVQIGDKLHLIEPHPKDDEDVFIEERTIHIQAKE